MRPGALGGSCFCCLCCCCLGARREGMSSIVKQGGGGWLVSNRKAEVYEEGGRTKKRLMWGCWSSGWEVITAYRRDTLIRAGVRYARHAAMLRSRRPRKCDGSIKQKTLCGPSWNTSWRTRKGWG